MLKIQVKSDMECSHCIFQEYEGSDCVIPEESGYESEYDREILDGYTYKPCTCRLEWEDAKNILMWFLKVQSHEVVTRAP